MDGDQIQRRIVLIHSGKKKIHWSKCIFNKLLVNLIICFFEISLNDHITLYDPSCVA